MNFFEYLEAVEGWPDGFWCDPIGKIHELDELQTHFNWLVNNTDFDNIEQAFKSGWVRMIIQGDDLYVHIEGNNINGLQRTSMIKFCEKNFIERMLLDRGNYSRCQVIWVR